MTRFKDMRDHSIATKYFAVLLAFLLTFSMMPELAYAASGTPAAHIYTVSGTDPK